MTTTIDAENAKQIRKQMDVLIKVEPASGSPIIINNENLIKAIVSLRSDLSLINPTLPESELNVEAYFDDEISDTLAEIPDETPITYQAGYTGDMSTVRKFYLAEQITWADNVMKIHAVDAVHYLDVKATPMVINEHDWYTQHNNPSTMASLYMTICYLLVNRAEILTDDDIEAKAELSNYGNIEGSRSYRSFSLIDGESIREFVRSAMWLFHISMPDGSPADSFWINYVDAGIPKLTWSKPESQWDIYESDCGEIKAFTERKIASITAPVKYYEATEFDGESPVYGGSGEWIKNKGIFLSFDKKLMQYIPRYDGEAIPPVTEYGNNHDFQDDWWANRMVVEYISEPGVSGQICGSHIYVNDLENGKISGEVYYTDDSSYHETIVYTSVIPWSNLHDSKWDSLFGSSATASQQIDIEGQIISEELKSAVSGTIGGDGIDVELENQPWNGTLGASYRNSGGNITFFPIYPIRCLNAIRNRSRKTGSFKWKGDPRMQPRDIFTFHRLDGTEEDCTLENITITHEKGGTSAEITYRKGIC